MLLKKIVWLVWQLARATKWPTGGSVLLHFFWRLHSVSAKMTVQLSISKRHVSPCEQFQAESDGFKKIIVTGNEAWVLETKESSRELRYGIPEKRGFRTFWGILKRSYGIIPLFQVDGYDPSSNKYNLITLDLESRFKYLSPTLTHQWMEWPSLHWSASFIRCHLLATRKTYANCQINCPIFVNNFYCTFKVFICCMLVLYTVGKTKSHQRWKGWCWCVLYIPSGISRRQF